MGKGGQDGATDVGEQSWQSAATLRRMDSVTGSEPVNKDGVPLAYAGNYHARDRTDEERSKATKGELLKDAVLFTLMGLAANGGTAALIALYLDSWLHFDLWGARDMVLNDPLMTTVFLGIVAAFSSLTYGVVCKKVKDRYYKRLRDSPSEWKCQPRIFLSKQRQREEWLLGCFNAALGTVYAVGMALCKLKYGWTHLYFDIFEYGIVWYIATIPMFFMWIQVYAYTLHRIMHLPFLYPHFHKIHHRYQPPTPASAIAQHPVEWTCFVVGGQAYFWVLPCHVSAAIIVGAYTIYELILDHSGVMMTSPWPWQPTTKFHDDHHRYFHCNFGQHTMMFDIMFGTVRKVGRVYGEDVFGGQGKTTKSAPEPIPAKRIDSLTSSEGLSDSEFNPSRNSTMDSLLRART